MKNKLAKLIEKHIEKQKLDVALCTTSINENKIMMIKDIKDINAYSLIDVVLDKLEYVKKYKSDLLIDFDSMRSDILNKIQKFQAYKNSKELLKIKNDIDYERYNKDVVNNTLKYAEKIIELDETDFETDYYITALRDSGVDHKNYVLARLSNEPNYNYHMIFAIKVIYDLRCDDYDENHSNEIQISIYEITKNDLKTLIDTAKNNQNK